MVPVTPQGVATAQCPARQAVALGRPPEGPWGAGVAGQARGHRAAVTLDKMESVKERGLSATLALGPPGKGACATGKDAPPQVSLGSSGSRTPGVSEEGAPSAGPRAGHGQEEGPRVLKLVCDTRI